MAKRRLFKVLSAVIDVKPGEEVLAVLLFSYFFLITAPFGIVKSLRDANYLDDLSAKSLPYAYLSALLVAFAVALHARLQSKLSRRRLILSTLVFFISTDLAFFALFSLSGWPWLSLIFWMWANTFVVALTTQFWILVNDLFNPREAKRLIGFFGSGGILGGIAGYLLTWFLAKSATSHQLLLLSAAFLAVCMIVVRAIFSWLKANEGRFSVSGSAAKPGRQDSLHVGLSDSFRCVRTNGYLRMMAAIVVVTGIVSTFIDWQSKSLIEQNPAARANFASFFGRFNAGILVFAFLFQLVLTSRFINRFGIRPGLMIYPLIILLCSTGIAVLPTLGFAIAIKGSDKALSYSINQSARELLYIPVPPDLKYRAKIFIDMFLNRFAKAAGGVILLGLLFIAGLKPIAATNIPPLVGISLVSGGFVLLWIILNFKISGAYVREVKGQLAKKWERADGVIAGKMDVDAAKLVVDTLEARAQSSTLFALHLHELARQNMLTPEIRSLLGLKPTEASAAPVRPLFESDAASRLPDFDELIPPSMLDQEIREISSLESYQKLVGEYVGKVIADKSAASETARMELAKAIGLMDEHSALSASLEDLLLDASPRVFQYAAESAGRIRKREYLPILVRKLADPKVGEDARTALGKYGDAITGMLADYLTDADEDPRVRANAASLLGGIATPESAAVLLGELAEGREDLREDLIDALDRVRSQRSDIDFSEEIVLGRFAMEVRKSAAAGAGALARTPAPAGAPGFTRGSTSAAMARPLARADSPGDLIPLFKLLGLIYDHEDIFRAYQNFLKGTKDSVAYAIEMLDNVVSLEIKAQLFPLLDRFSGKSEGSDRR